MWVESITLSNIKCFREEKIFFTHKQATGQRAKPYCWITLLGENGVGKISCERCNDAGHKGTQFPLDSNGNPLLIDPTDGVTDINKHLQFSWDNVDGATVVGLDVRGKAVEQIFDLNSIRGTRKELIKHRTKYVQQILSVLTIALETGNSQAIALLLEHCHPSAEYSAFARIHVLPILAHHFHVPDAIALLKEFSKQSPEYATVVRVDQLPS